jgi:hypothetical protein
VDVPVTAVFIFLFILGAVGHMTLLQMNLKRRHKFILSGLMFGFCMARITACVLRIVWATRPSDGPVAIAAQIFVAAGVVLLFVVNLMFAQRIVRASHPTWGWHPVFSKAFVLIYVLIVITLVMLITTIVQSSYTLNQNTRRIDRNIQLYGGTFNAVVGFVPILLVLAALIIPRTKPLEKFGTGRFRSQIFILVIASALLTLGAAFRVGVNYTTPRPRNRPAWFHSKACFFIFNFLIEWVVIVFYLVVRVDLRFHVPNGSTRAGDYSGQNANHVASKDGGNGENNNGEESLAEEKVLEDPRLPLPNPSTAALANTVMGKYSAGSVYK